jgi:hypothetical protein
MPVALQLPTPDAVPALPLSVAHLTCTTPTLSAALPPRENGVDFVEYVLLVVGVLIDTVGLVVSVGAVGALGALV